jgi:hypothetical protein
MHVLNGVERVAEGRGHRALHPSRMSSTVSQFVVVTHLLALPGRDVVSQHFFSPSIRNNSACSGGLLLECHITIIVSSYVENKFDIVLMRP